MFAAAAVSISKVLKPGHSHVYIWKTIGYNRSDTIADVGIYRILFGYETYTNQFEIRKQHLETGKGTAIEQPETDLL